MNAVRGAQKDCRRQCGEGLGGCPQNEVIDGQPGPESSQVVVLELANCRQKVPSAPDPFAQAAMEDRHDFGPYKLRQADLVCLLQQVANGPRFLFWDVELGHCRGVADDHRSPRTASRSSRTLPDGLRESSASYSASSVRRRRLGARRAWLANTATGFPRSVTSMGERDLAASR